MKKAAPGIFLLVLVGTILAGCQSAAPTFTPGATPTTAPPATSTATPTPTATATPTATNSPTPTSAAACTLTAQEDVIVFQRPSSAAGQFGTLATSDTVQATIRTADGWLGFDPAVAQAPNVGVFRFRWIGPDAAVAREGGCDGLPLAPAVSPTACYFMAMTNTPVYSAPDAGSFVQFNLASGGYAVVSGQTTSGWYQLELPLASGEVFTVWLNPADGNFNGPCDSLPTVAP